MTRFLALCWLCATAACAGPAPSPAAPAAPLVIGTTPAPASRTCAAASRIHVTIAPVTNQTDRPAQEIEAIVRSALVRKLAQAPAIVLSKEAHVAGRCELVLVPQVAPFAYEAGNLRVKLGLGVTRPDGNLIGSVSKVFSKQGVAKADHASENQVLTLAAEQAATELGSRAHLFADEDDTEDPPAP